MTDLIKTLEGIRDEHAHERNAFLGVPGKQHFVDRAQKKVDALNEAIAWLDNYEPKETGDAWSGGFAENH